MLMQHVLVLWIMFMRHSKLTLVVVTQWVLFHLKLSLYYADVPLAIRLCNFAKMYWDDHSSQLTFIGEGLWGQLRAKFVSQVRWLQASETCGQRITENPVGSNVHGFILLQGPVFLAFTISILFLFFFGCKSSESWFHVCVLLCCFELHIDGITNPVISEWIAVLLFV